MNTPPIAVIKVGGDMLTTDPDKQGLASNIKDLLNDGWQCVLLHGGGPQVNLLQQQLGLEPNKVAGRRITSADDLKVVTQALCGEVNVQLVSALIKESVSAFGCHGASGCLIQATKRPPMKVTGLGDALIDFGEVGDVAHINTTLIHSLLSAGQVPVIASLGVGLDGRIFNINADTTVAAIAKELQADLLILSTGVGGVFSDISDPNSRISKITSESAKSLINDGIITDGMIPKVEESLALLEQGVASIVIANASQRGCFLDIANQCGSIGTQLALS